ncbi:carbohydrate-binding family 9-like protein [Paenibacillus pasadenensis]|uniref:carbohydrate-binding family 9-like protein n=1 Tax=Paenibacillus pasadenensis TaxID=217090 RepID=UPI00203DCAA4|nr:carbohydrate-binding family 9-like protein [Paenibacillus pasadenensis]
MTTTSYFIRKMNTGGPEAAFSNEPETPPAAVSHFLWMDNGYRPRTEAVLSYTDYELTVSFRVYESDPLIRFKDANEPVYKDSCVELFLQPSPETDARYLNLELNAAGTRLLGIGTNRDDRRLLQPDEHPSLRIEAAAGLRDAATGETYWCIQAKLPFDWITELFPDFKPISGAVMRGNLYKCGDETELPHYGCWSEIKSSNPNFHCSEWFGELVLG